MDMDMALAPLMYANVNVFPVLLVGESLHFLVPECWFGLLASLRQIATFSPCSNRVK